MNKSNNMVNVLIVKDRSKGINCYEIVGKKIDRFIGVDTLARLSTQISEGLFEDIQSTCEDIKEMILNGLLEKNEKDVIYHKPFIGNERLESFITYKEDLKN